MTPTDGRGVSGFILDHQDRWNIVFEAVLGPVEQYWQ